MSLRFFTRQSILDETRSDIAMIFYATKLFLARSVGKVKVTPNDSKIKLLGIKWRFNAPRAPMWGCSSERLVSTVKKRLAHLELRNQSLELIWTNSCEVETRVSSRSLVGQFGEEPSLTPGHVLAGRQLLSLSMVSSLPHPDSVFKIDFQLCQLVGHFWRRRTNEDILILKREREEVPNSLRPQVDEWVFEGLRGEWSLARIGSFAVHVSLSRGVCRVSRSDSLR